MIDGMTVQTLKAKLDQASPLVMVDVREENELVYGQLPGSYHIPLDELEDRLDELTPSDTVVMVCRSGKRSRVAAEMLKAHGFSKLYNLVGGMNQWASDIDPDMVVY